MWLNKEIPKKHFNTKTYFECEIFFLKNIKHFFRKIDDNFHMIFSTRRILATI